jgi:hypothetical protein
VQKVEAREKKNFKKKGYSPTAEASTRGRRATAGRRPRINASACRAVPSFLKFFYLKKKNFWKFGKWARAFGRMGVQHPHFLNDALHLEVLIL